MKPCIRLREVELPDGTTKRVFIIRVTKHGDPTCPTCWSVYKITKGTRLICHWCENIYERIPRIKRRTGNPIGQPASPKVKEMHRRLTSPLPAPPLMPTGT